MSQRVRRASESIKEVVAEILPGLKDPRIGFVTVTDVRMTPDLRAAEVFYTTLPDDETSVAQTADGLRSAAPLVRRELGNRLRLKYLPDVTFTNDPVAKRGRRIEELLAEQPEQPEQVAQPEQPEEVGDADH